MAHLKRCNSQTDRSDNLALYVTLRKATVLLGAVLLFSLVLMLETRTVRATRNLALPKEKVKYTALKSQSRASVSSSNQTASLEASIRHSTATNELDESKQQPIPSILLAGTQKAGTTSLVQYMMSLSNMCVSNDGQDHDDGGKESHFFDHMYEQGLSKYQQLFRHCSKNDTLIDGTPETMLFADRVRAIYDEHGMTTEVKIIFVLREPVSREISWYNHLMRYTNVSVDERPVWVNDAFHSDGSPKDFIQFERDFVIRAFKDPQDDDYIRGNYVQWLRPWFDLFDRSQILILSYDELIQDAVTVLRRLHEFLDLPQTRPLQLVKANTKGRDALLVSCRDQNEVHEYFVGPNTELYKLLEANPGPPMEQTPFPHFEYECERLDSDIRVGGESS